MNPNETVVLILGGAVIVGLFAYISSQDDPTPVPSNQKESQVMGFGVQADTSIRAGTPLDMDTSIHFYTPGFDPVKGAQPMTNPRHRYPAIPGGNTSSVMHKGWTAFGDDAPADNDWRLNPPEAAVL